MVLLVAAVAAVVAASPAFLRALDCVVVQTSCLVVAFADVAAVGMAEVVVAEVVAPAAVGDTVRIGRVAGVDSHSDNVLQLVVVDSLGMET